MIYDGAANVSIFHSKHIVDDIWNLVDTVRVKGIVENEVIKLRKKGRFLDTEVWLSAQASTNILCRKDANMHHIIFELEDWEPA